MIMPVDILHLLGTAEPDGSGIARIVASLAAHLDREKYRLHAWFLGRSGPLVEELSAAGATPRVIAWDRGAKDPLGALRFLRALKDHRFALVHQHVGARTIRQLIHSFTDARLVVHVHGRVAENASARLAARAVQGADAVIAVSNSVADQFERSCISVVYSGVEIPGPIHRRPEDSPASVVIGVACRLVPPKGVMALIHATASLSTECPGLRLEIAGEGPQPAAPVS